MPAGGNAVPARTYELSAASGNGLPGDDDAVPGRGDTLSACFGWFGLSGALRGLSLPVV
jgi:hypothetical protein